MKKLAYCSIITLLVLMLIGLGFISTPANASNHKWKFPYNPIIFVHGYSGSGQQFESQAMRFTSNGYPQNYIAVLEYDTSTIVVGQPIPLSFFTPIWANLDLLIANLLTETGANQVDILGHSLGTDVMYGYLTSLPTRAANVAHYVNIDGQANLPDGVPTLALWAGADPPAFQAMGPRSMPGATNVTIPGVTHVECATCAASFLQMYQFFTGQVPETTDILPEPSDHIRLAGRAIYFVQNLGVANSTLQIYKVNGHTGARIDTNPEATYAIGADGNWGPFMAKAGEHYEFVLVPTDNTPHHFYYEPFIRSDYLIRLLESPPGPTGLDYYTVTSANQSDLVISRNREFWGDQGVNNGVNNNDILAINGVNIVNAATCPLSSLINGIFVFGEGPDGVSNLNQPIPFFAAIPFLTGVDLYIPGANPPDGRIRLVLMPRGGEGKMQVLNVPNWASTTDRILIQFNDFLQREDIPCGNGAKYW